MIYDDINGAMPDYIKSFGFAALIEIEGKKILFDAGTKEEVLHRNLSECGISSSEIDAVILSHNHYDHVNGLSAIMKNNTDVPVYVHKFWNNMVKHKGDSIPPNNIRVIQRGRKIHEINKKIYITNCYQSRDYGGIHEQACYLEADDSFILLCGCTHPGLNVFLNDRISLEIPKNTPLHIIGGFHSFKFSSDKVKEINPLIRSIVIFHCTQNIKTFQSQFQAKCSIGIVGKTYLF